MNFFFFNTFYYALMQMLNLFQPSKKKPSKFSTSHMSTLHRRWLHSKQKEKNFSLFFTANRFLLISQAIIALKFQYSGFHTYTVDRYGARPYVSTLSPHSEVLQNSSEYVLPPTPRPPSLTRCGHNSGENPLASHSTDLTIYFCISLYVAEQLLPPR